MTDIYKELAKPFPPNAVHWRQGGKSKYLAYIDARDVMDRLDEVIGAENWQDKYHETPSGRIICELSIRYGDEWVTKSDGAGDTSFEGAKGGISDAFKRAAVRWSIGRYLYDLPIVDSKQEGREILLQRYNVMSEEDARLISQLLDAAEPETGEGVLAFAEAWLELNSDEQLGFSPWVSKFYPGNVSKTKEHMRNVMAAYRNIHGEN